MKRMVLFLTILTSTCFCMGPIKSSVIIPCGPGHLKYIPNLLQYLSDQTKLPYEVIISISEVRDKHKNIIQQINSKEYPFILKMYLSPKRQYTGLNRDIAIKASTGNFIICQDADDIPHPRRIECIEEIYQNNPDVNLIMHGQIMLQYEFVEGENINDYINDYTSIDVLKFKKYVILKNPNFFNDYNNKYSHFHKKFIINGKSLQSGIHMGNSAFPRKTYDIVQYMSCRGEDYFFAQALLSRKNMQLYATHTPLVFYLNYRSIYRIVK